MSISIGEGLRMLQGGVDRTGFADMADSLGNPGMDLIAARRAAVAEAEAMDEYERQQAERDAEFRDELNEILGDMKGEEGKGDESDLDINETAMSKYGTTVGLAPFLAGVGVGAPLSALGLGSLGLIDKFTVQNPMINERLKELDPDFDENSYFNQMMQGGGFGGFLNEGGRVGMFLGGSSGTVSPNQGAQALNQSGLGGGLMSLISQNPLYQTMLQQYRQPTMDFSQVASPSIPQPSVAPATPPQAYTPFVSTMPLYDPSTLGTGLPSTAGMADPFFVYDPYSPVGAFDAPPARTGPTPLTQDKIMETFKNLDKFTLEKQKAKPAVQPEKKKKPRREHRGGEGMGANRN